MMDNSCACAVQPLGSCLSKKKRHCCVVNKTDNTSGEGSASAELKDLFCMFSVSSWGFHQGSVVSSMHVPGLLLQLLFSFL